MNGRIISGIVVVGLLAGCGGEEEYNTLPPEPSAAPPPATKTKTKTRKVTKPPAAPRPQHVPIAK